MPWVKGHYRRSPGSMPGNVIGCLALVVVGGIVAVIAAVARALQQIPPLVALLMILVPAVAVIVLLALKAQRDTARLVAERSAAAEAEVQRQTTEAAVRATLEAEQARRASELEAERIRLVGDRSFGVTYLGGHPDLPTGGDAWIGRDGGDIVLATRADQASVRIPMGVIGAITSNQRERRTMMKIKYGKVQLKLLFAGTDETYPSLVLLLGKGSS